MPPRQKKVSLEAQITAAVSLLRDHGYPELAEAVKSLAATTKPGWAERPVDGATVSFRADRKLLARVGEGRLSEVAVAGCRRFVAGDLAPVRAGYGPAAAKKGTSVRIPDAAPDDLLTQVQRRCKELTAELGWQVRPVNVFLAAFEADSPAPPE